MVGECSTQGDVVNTYKRSFRIRELCLLVRTVLCKAEFGIDMKEA